MTRHELDSAAIARIAGRIRERGPGIVRRARFVRRATPIATVALGLALLLLILPDPEVEPIADARACAAWSARDVDGRIVAVGAVTIDASEPCATQLEVERGRAVILVRELGGGELRVRSGEQIAIARGGLFALERDGARLAIEVAEGEIALRSTSIVAGERAILEGESISRAPLSEVSRREMSIAVGLIADLPEIEEIEEVEEIEAPAPRKRVKKRKPAEVRPVEAAPVEAAPVEATPGDLLLEAHEARKRGELAKARELFARAGRSIESAWVSLARMELDASRPDAAIAALDERQRHHGDGSLAVEAAWLRVRALDARGDRERATVEAKRIVERWPTTPYADSAREWLKKR